MGKWNLRRSPTGACLFPDHSIIACPLSTTADIEPLPHDSACMPMSVRHLAGAMALFLAACSQAPDQVVTSTRHCSEVKLTPDLTIRLSSYYGYPDSITMWVLQSCHATGTACSPLLTYSHAPPPVYRVAGSTVSVNILGGSGDPAHA